MTAVSDWTLTLAGKNRRPTVAELRRRPIESLVTLRQSRFPDAAAAQEQHDWLSSLEIAGAAQTTLEGYSWATDRLLGLFPDTRFDQFTDSHLLQYMKLFPPASRPRIKHILSSWFKWARRTRRISENPVEFLPDFKKQLAPKVEIFTVEEEAALRALPEPHGTMMAVLFDTGIRKAEARYLTAKRFDFEREQLIILDGAKGGKQRTVPIDQASTPFLMGRLDQLFTMEGIGPDDHLWWSRPGGGSVIRRDRPCHPASFHYWWVDCITAAGVTYRKPHTTRHTFATRWRKRGLDLEDIQFLLGHESIVTTQQIYVHTDLADVALRMAATRKES